MRAGLTQPQPLHVQPKLPCEGAAGGREQVQAPQPGPALAWGKRRPREGQEHAWGEQQVPSAWKQGRRGVGALQGRGWPWRPGRQGTALVKQAGMHLARRRRGLLAGNSFFRAKHRCTRDKTGL